MAEYTQCMVLTSHNCGAHQCRYYGPFDNYTQARLWAWKDSRDWRGAKSHRYTYAWPQGYMWIQLSNPKLTKVLKAAHEHSGHRPCVFARTDVGCLSPHCQGWWDTNAGKVEGEPWYCRACHSAQPITAEIQPVDAKLEHVWSCEYCTWYFS